MLGEKGTDRHEYVKSAGETDMEMGKKGGCMESPHKAFCQNSTHVCVLCSSHFGVGRACDLYPAHTI